MVTVVYYCPVEILLLLMVMVIVFTMMCGVVVWFVARIYGPLLTIFASH